MGRNPIEVSDFGREVSRAVRAKLGERRMSGRELAAGINRGETYVRERLADKQEFRLADVARIAKFLGISVDELLK